MSDESTLKKMDDETLLAQINAFDPYDVEFCRRYREAKDRIAELEGQEAGLLRQASDNHDALCRAEAAEAKLEKAVDTILDTAASLNAAIPLLERGGKKAAASDKMFFQMLTDYNGSLDRACHTLKELKDKLI